MSKPRWGFITFVAAILILFSAYRIFTASNFSDAAGWVQVLLAAVGLPILWHELSQIRQAILQKPSIEIGVASVKDLPLSKIRSIKTLPKNITVSKGYPHFMLVIQNHGEISAKFVKIHLEFVRSSQKSLLSPTVKISEFSKEKKGFQAENNVDFMLNGGLDWGIHPNDFEVFSFHLSTVVVKQTEPHEIRENPDSGECEFLCTVWAEGLSQPKVEKLVVKIE